MRLHFRSPAPAGYLPGWPPAKPELRCACGARVVARSVRFTSCARGCVHLTPRHLVVTPELVKAKPPGKKPPAKTAKKPPKKAKPAPAPLTPEQARFRRLLSPLRVLEHQFVGDQRRGRPASAGVVALALVALHRFREACPGHVAEIAAALPFLTRKAGRAA